MPVVSPLTKEQAAPEVQETFSKLAARAGKVPNFFSAMAHQPAVLNAFVPLYSAIINQGTVEAKYKELAYLRASMVNGCEYCSRAHMASSKPAGVTAEQIAALLFYKSSPLFDEKEKATILYADRVTRAAATIRPAELEDQPFQRRARKYPRPRRVTILREVREYRCECAPRSMDADRPESQNDRVVEAIRNQEGYR